MAKQKHNLPHLSRVFHRGTLMPQCPYPVILNHAAKKKIILNLQTFKRKIKIGIKRNTESFKAAGLAGFHHTEQICYLCFIS